MSDDIIRILELIGRAASKASARIGSAAFNASKSFANDLPSDALMNLAQEIERLRLDEISTAPAAVDPRDAVVEADRRHMAIISPDDQPIPFAAQKLSEALAALGAAAKE